MKSVFIIIITLLFFSCGKSEEEVQKEIQRKIDSVNTVRQKERREDSIKKVIEKAQIEAREQAKKEFKEELKKEINAHASNPLNYLKVDVIHEKGGFFQNPYLNIRIWNKDDKRRIANVTFVVYSYTKTDVLLDNFKMTIYDFINPGKAYNTKLKYKNFNSLAKKYSAKIISAEFK